MNSFTKLGLLIIFISSFRYAKQQNVIPENGKFSEQMNFTLNSNARYSVLFNPPKSNVSYNIEAWTTTIPTAPVQVVVEEHENVIIWEVPTTNKTSRPLCSRHLWSNDSVKDYNFTVRLWTTSSSNISFHLNVTTKELVVKTNGPTNGKYHFSISSSQPHYYLYNKDQTAVVTIDVQTESDNCMNVFIQENQCPFWYFNGSVCANSFQTRIEKSALLTIRENQIGNFFIIFVKEVDEQHCKSKVLRDQLKRNVTVIISKQVRDPTWPIVTICAISIAFCIYCAIVEWRLGPKRDVTKNGDHDDQEHLISVETQHVGLQANFIPEELHRKYASVTVITAFYYAIPAIQLVVTKLFQSYNGDVDICYYNRRCANPVGIFADFNHVFSNIGYILVGISFRLIIARRDKNRNGSTKNFILFLFYGDTSMPLNYDYDIYYALGAAVIAEGIFSACYHVCPNNTDFQFDTTFMYVIVILSMASLYQKRHRNKTPSPFWIFCWLATILQFVLVGLLDLSDNSTYWYIILAICYEFMVLLVLLFNYKRGLQGQLIFADIIYLVVLNVVTIVLLIGTGFLFVNQYLDFASIVLFLLIVTCFLYTSYFIIQKKWLRQEPVQNRAFGYFIISIVVWAEALYCFVHNNMDWKLTPAESNLKNEECIFMHFFDYHDLWHLFSATALHLTFMFLLAIDD